MYSHISQYCNDGVKSSSAPFLILRPSEKEYCDMMASLMLYVIFFHVHLNESSK